MAGGRTAVAARRAWILTALGLVSVAILGVYRRYLGGTAASVSAGKANPLYAAAVTVVPGIHVLGGLFPSAAYVIETSDGLILVDSGLAADAGPLKVEMAKLGLDWRQVRAILLTHVHGDHSGGAAALRAATGARVYAGAGDAAVLRAGGPREAFFSTFHMPDEVPHPTTVDVELHGGETIVVGDVRVQAIATPGHTPGSICYLADCRGLRAFFAGDVIMMLQGDDPPRSELDKPLGTYSAYLPPRYRGDARDSLATLRRLRRAAGARPGPARPPARPVVLAPTPGCRKLNGNPCSTAASATWKRWWPAMRPTAPISWTATPRCSCPTSITWAIAAVRPSMDSSPAHDSSSWTRPAVPDSSRSLTSGSASSAGSP